MPEAISILWVEVNVEVAALILVVKSGHPIMSLQQHHGISRAASAALLSMSSHTV
jgi:hypothetical protein